MIAMFKFATGDVVRLKGGGTHVVSEALSIQCPGGRIYAYRLALDERFVAEDCLEGKEETASELNKHECNHIYALGDVVDVGRSHQTDMIVALVMQVVSGVVQVQYKLARFSCEFNEIALSHHKEWDERKAK